MLVLVAGEKGKGMRGWMDWGEIGMGRKEDHMDGRTKYQPVGLPVSPIFPWEVRTKRTLGSSGMIAGVFN